MPDVLLNTASEAPLFRAKPALKVFVAGHQGMVSQAFAACFATSQGLNWCWCSRAQLDLSRQAQVEQFFAATQAGLGDYRSR